MWEKMAICVRKVASEVLGVTKGSGCDSKDTWWWNEDVQQAIKQKKKCYKPIKKTAKRAVSEAKGRAYEDLYRHLSMKEGEKDIYRMAWAHDRKTRDFNQVKCIKDERE